MARALLMVLDSVGIGGAPDAAHYGDAGANTLGHIASALARHGGLHLPNLDALGLGLAAISATGQLPSGLTRPLHPLASHGSAIETSPGKDTPSGHWEIAGSPVDFKWGYFPDSEPTLPPALLAALIAQGGLPGILGDCHASGTAIIAQLGRAHCETGMPICYTSADSVLQIAAHEGTFGLNRLYVLCRVARALCDPLRIGRIIARPFIGTPEAGFTRTANRKDFAIPPPPGGLLDRAAAAERAVVTVGKIGDIFAHRNTGTEVKGATNDANIDLTLEALRTLPEGGLVFANYVDFDSDFGHRRDVAGYGLALERFDARLPAIMACLKQGDLMMITADHGNDPTWKGSDHTREQVPVLAFGPGRPGRQLGVMPTMADIGAMVAQHLNI